MTSDEVMLEEDNDVEETIHGDDEEDDEDGTAFNFFINYFIIYKVLMRLISGSLYVVSNAHFVSCLCFLHIFFSSLSS